MLQLSAWVIVATGALFAARKRRIKDSRRRLVHLWLVMSYLFFCLLGSWRGLQSS